MMKDTSVEEKIISKYEQNIRKNEDALDAVRHKEADLERQEDNLHAMRMHLSRYCDEQREKYAGTDEVLRYNRMESDIHELTALSRKLLDKEHEELEKEKKRLCNQQEKIHEEYRSEIRAYRSKEEH